MATVESSDIVVVVEFGVPLSAMLALISQSSCLGMRVTYGPMSEGVIGSAGGGGRLIRVGAFPRGLSEAIVIGELRIIASRIHWAMSC